MDNILKINKTVDEINKIIENKNLILTLFLSAFILLILSVIGSGLTLFKLSFFFFIIYFVLILFSLFLSFYYYYKNKNEKSNIEITITDS